MRQSYSAIQRGQRFGRFCRGILALQLSKTNLGHCRMRGQSRLRRSLREYAQHGDDRVRQRFKDVPLYIRDAIWAVSRQYVAGAPGAGVYSHFVKRLMLDSGFRVLFLTLNYDDLLEQALARWDSGLRIQRMDDYVAPSRQALIIKLHGSIDWITPMGLRQEQTWEEAFEHFDGLTAASEILWHDVGQECRARDYSYSGKLKDARWVYPVITAPLAGKSDADIVCPASHIATLKDLLRNCGRYLFVGTSGLDDDLLAVLGQSVPDQSLAHYVSASDVGDVAKRVESTVPQFRVMSEVAGIRYGRGFREYVLSGEFQQFLKPIDQQIVEHVRR